MQQWLHSHYDVLKDFSGPAVTMFAALVAASITGFFAYVQYRLAMSQKNIALDKLKLDVFERRYKIYSAAKELCELLLRKGELKTRSLIECMLCLWRWMKHGFILIRAFEKFWRT